MLLQLDPPLWLNTPKGEGSALFLESFGIELSLYWIVAQEDGQIWRWPNEKVRACKNITAERPAPEVPRETP